LDDKGEDVDAAEGAVAAVIPEDVFAVITPINGVI
jgi:hypothetical protein